MKVIKIILTSHASKTIFFILNECYKVENVLKTSYCMQYLDVPCASKFVSTLCTFLSLSFIGIWYSECGEAGHC